MGNITKLENRAATTWKNGTSLGIRVWRKLPVWLPLVAMPLAAWRLFGEWPAWLLMWAMAVAVYIGLKWLTFADFVETGTVQQNSTAAAKTARAPRTGRMLGYLLFWPGMDPTTFFAEDRPVPRPSLQRWLFAISKFVLGLALLLGATWLVRQVPLTDRLAREKTFLIGWVAWIGMAFVFHFGLFHLLALAWQRGGVDARPIMQAPILAHSLSDLWGRRWNLAFRDAAHRFVFQPLVKPIGTAGAMMGVFLVSGVVHDVVISIAAGAGWGLPTLYFLLQGLGVLMERSPLGAKWGLRRGFRGRLFTALVAVLPMPLLFHGPFIEQVVVPMVQAIGNVV